VADVGLGQLARPRLARANGALWAARIGIGAGAFAAGRALAQVSDPLVIAVAAVLGTIALAVAIAQPRWCLVGALLLLVGYVPDVVASGGAAHALIVVVLIGVLGRRAMRRERFALPAELLGFVALALAYFLASLFATNRAAATAETLDLVSYATVVGLLMVLLDTPAWLRRAAWAVVLGIGLLAAIAVLQQVTKTYGATYGGFAAVLPAGDAIRSAGPLNPNPFGQVLATSAVLAFYLARVHRGTARTFAAAVAFVCVVGVTYTQSRAALIALLVASLGIGVLCGVRVRVLATALCGVILLGSLVLPQSLQTRVGDLYGAVTADAGTPQDKNGSLRGRTSENLAGLRMWHDHPLIGVGPDNFEVHYEQYAEVIGTDQRAQERGAHNLYLESLAETGVVGASAFFAVLWLALRGAWRARRSLAPRDALLAEGVFVALGTFLVCALTLHSAYARYEWIFIGLALAAGRLGRQTR
jgi:putative inorganic carbon (HCO3(-)) transporter